MNSYRKSDEVCEGLGEKVLEALGSAIPRTRIDLERYRTLLPDIVVTSSPRGLANWFHDRIWYHLVSDLQDLDNVVIVDKGPLREIVVEDTYRIRIKCHDQRGRIRTYPTQTALEFLSQPQLVLEGLAQTHLMAGYQWNSTTHEIGPAVLSLRDGLDTVLWLIELPEPADDASVESITGPHAPESPRIEFPADDERESEVDGR